MSQWRAARPEVIIVAILVAAAAVAALAVASWAGVAVVATVTAVLVLLALRGLAPRPAPESTRKAAESDPSTMRSATGYSQRRFMVAGGMSSRSFYEADLRPELEHLLAARLAERHGLNLYTDTEQARRVFLATRADERLWEWVAPRSPAAGKPGSPEVRAALAAEPDSRGIPRRTLAAIIDRLEHL